MKKKIAVMTLVVALNACVLSGCGTAKIPETSTTQATEASTNSTTENDTEETTTEQITESNTEEAEPAEPSGGSNKSQADDDSSYYFNDVYKDILDKYRIAFDEKWDYGKCIDEDICPLITNADTMSPDEIGAALIDMDNDGYDELIIGNPQDTSSKSVYEIWTYDGRTATKLISAQERCLINVGYVKENSQYFISAMGANSATEFEYNYYNVHNGSLQKDQSIISVAVSDTEMNWYQCDADSDTRKELDEDTANAINISYSSNWFLPQYLSIEPE